MQETAIISLERLRELEATEKAINERKILCKEWATMFRPVRTYLIDETDHAYVIEHVDKEFKDIVENMQIRIDHLERELKDMKNKKWWQL